MIDLYWCPVRHAWIIDLDMGEDWPWPDWFITGMEEDIVVANTDMHTLFNSTIYCGERFEKFLKGEIEYPDEFDDMWI